MAPGRRPARRAGFVPRKPAFVANPSGIVTFHRGRNRPRHVLLRHPRWGIALELQVRNLSKTYANGVHALRDVSLTVRPGMFGLLGPNGAGKSTLMRTIATLQQPDSGEIRLGDIDVLREPGKVRETL